MKVSNEKLETLRELANAANTWSALDNTPLMPYSKADCEYGSRDHQFIAAANPETVSAMAQELVELRAQNKWVRVEDMPKRRFKPGQFGKEYLIHPHVNGNATAFFGTRITDAPLFYKYGSVLHGVTHYAELPASPEEE